MNLTAFVLGMIVTLSYYFYTTRKARREFDVRSRNKEMGTGSSGGPTDKE